MTEARPPHVNEVLAAFRLARERAGFGPAMDVVRRFGAQYVAMIPQNHYEAAIFGLNAVAQGHAAAAANERIVLEPDRVKGRGTKGEAR